MQEIDLGSDVVFSVKYNGQQYQLTEPSLEQVEEYQKAVKGKDEDPTFDDLVGFLSSLGIPSEVLRKMGITKLKKLTDGLLGGLEKK